MAPSSTSSPAAKPAASLEDLLEAIKGSNALLAQLARQNSAINQQLAELLELVNGFTSGGASFSAYQSDAFTSAYMAIIGPLVAAQLANRGGNFDELTKGAILMARQVLEELSAYRSTRGPADYLEEQAAHP